MGIACCVLLLIYCRPRFVVYSQKERKKSVKAWRTSRLNTKRVLRVVMFNAPFQARRSVYPPENHAADRLCGFLVLGACPSHVLTAIASHILLQFLPLVLSICR